jgi:uncharacterized membrane protein
VSPFQSMTNVTVYICITVFFLVLFAIRKNPFLAAGQFVQDMFRSRIYLIHFIGVIGILFINKIELSFEHTMNSHNDFTTDFFKIEGLLVGFVQQFFHNDALTYFTTYFYVVVFTAVMAASIGIYTFERNYKLFYAVCYATMINYLIAIPFYLFFPIREVWDFNPTVHLLITDVFPRFEQEYRPMSGINNCFPSLHTSISVSMAVIAHRSGNVFWRRFTKFSASIIIFSIFYLGIHWLIDMCAGVLLGLLAGSLALRLSEGRQQFSSFGLKNPQEERQLGE